MVHPCFIGNLPLISCMHCNGYDVQIIRLVGEVFSSPDKLAVCFFPASNSLEDHMEVENEEGRGEEEEEDKGNNMEMDMDMDMDKDKGAYQSRCRRVC